MITDKSLIAEDVVDGMCIARAMGVNLIWPEDCDCE